MTLIKVVLVVAFLAIVLWAFRNRQRVGLRAGVRVLIVVLAALGVASVVQPGLTQEAADLLGVTRGTDLVLYLLVVIFALTSAGFYFRFREVDRRLVDIVRADAVRTAVAQQGVPGARLAGPVDGPDDDARPSPPLPRVDPGDTPA